MSTQSTPSIHVEMACQSFDRFLLECENTLWVGDGYCDDVTNNEQCNFDGEDCCGIEINIEFCTKCQCFGGNGTKIIGFTTSESAILTTSEGLLIINDFPSFCKTIISMVFSI